MIQDGVSVKPQLQDPKRLVRAEAVPDQQPRFTPRLLPGLPTGYTCEPLGTCSFNIFKVSITLGSRQAITRFILDCCYAA